MLVMKISYNLERLLNRKLRKLGIGRWSPSQKVVRSEGESMRVKPRVCRDCLLFYKKLIVYFFSFIVYSDHYKVLGVANEKDLERI